MLMVLSLTITACQKQRLPATHAPPEQPEGVELIDTQDDIGVGLKTGDLIFQITDCDPCRAIQSITRSPYSHMGIVVETDSGMYVLEAGAKVRSVPLAWWVQKGKDSIAIVLRHRDRDQLFAGSQEQAFVTNGFSYLGLPYDMQFNWSDSAMYCSELAYKMYERSLQTQIAKLNLLKNYNYEEEWVKTMLLQNYHNQVPWNERVVAPSDILKSSAFYKLDIDWEILFKE